MLPILHAPKTTNRGGGGRNRRHAVRFSPLYHAHHPTQQQKRAYIAQQKAGNSRSLTSFIFLLSDPSSGLFLCCPSSACVCVYVCCAAKVVCLQFLLLLPALTQTRMRGRSLWSFPPLSIPNRGVSFLPSSLSHSLYHSAREGCLFSTPSFLPSVIMSVSPPSLFLRRLCLCTHAAGGGIEGG